MVRLGSKQIYADDHSLRVFRKKKTIKKRKGKTDSKHLSDNMLQFHVAQNQGQTKPLMVKGDMHGFSFRQ